jgi:hypothetical protein
VSKPCVNGVIEKMPRGLNGSQNDPGWPDA